MAGANSPTEARKKKGGDQGRMMSNRMVTADDPDPLSLPLPPSSKEDERKKGKQARSDGGCGQEASKTRGKTRARSKTVGSHWRAAGARRPAIWGRRRDGV